NHDLAAIGAYLNALAATVYFLLEVTNLSTRLLNVVAIDQDFAEVRRSIDFKPGCRWKFDANVSRGRTQPPVVVQHRLYLQIPFNSRAQETTFRAGHLNSSDPRFYGCIGGPHDHKNDVAIFCFCAHPLNRTNA